MMQKTFPYAKDDLNESFGFGSSLKEKMESTRYQKSMALMKDCFLPTRYETCWERKETNFSSLIET